MQPSDYVTSADLDPLTALVIAPALMSFFGPYLSITGEIKARRATRTCRFMGAAV
jgi:hypothetical protein